MEYILSIVALGWFGLSLGMVIWFITELLIMIMDRVISKDFVLSLILIIVIAGPFIYTLHKYMSMSWECDSDPFVVENIVSLNDNNLVNGQMYARRCYVNEDLYYQYMKQLNDGGLIAGKVRASIATVYYDRENFRIEWYHKHKQYFIWAEEETYVKIYIPKGSLSNEYIVDLE